MSFEIKWKEKCVISKLFIKKKKGLFVDYRFITLLLSYQTTQQILHSFMNIYICAHNACQVITFKFDCSFKLFI